MPRWDRAPGHLAAPAVTHGAAVSESVLGPVQASGGDRSGAMGCGEKPDSASSVITQGQEPRQLTDCGAGMAHSVTAAVLECTDIFVLSSGSSTHGLTRAARTVDWLAAHDYPQLVERAVRAQFLVVRATRPSLLAAEAVLARIDPWTNSGQAAGPATVGGDGQLEAQQVAQGPDRGGGCSGQRADRRHGVCAARRRVAR